MLYIRVIWIRGQSRGGAIKADGSRSSGPVPLCVSCVWETDRWAKREVVPICFEHGCIYQSIMNSLMNLWWISQGHKCTRVCMHTKHRHPLVLTCMALFLIVYILCTYTALVQLLYINSYKLNQWPVTFMLIVLSFLLLALVRSAFSGATQ